MQVDPEIAVADLSLTRVHYLLALDELIFFLT